MAQAQALALVSPVDFRDTIKEAGKRGEKNSPQFAVTRIGENKDSVEYLVAFATNHGKFTASLKFFKNYAGSYKPLFAEFSTLTWLPAAQVAGDSYDYSLASAPEKALMAQFYQIVETYYDTSWLPLLADFEDNEDGYGAL